MKTRRYKNWTDKQVEEVLSLYGTIPTTEIAKQIGKPVGSIYYILAKENISLNLSYWTDKEIDFLKENYADTPNSDLRNTLKRSEDAIQLKASYLGLSKDRFWTEDEEEELGKMKLAGLTYEQMSEMLNKTETSIHNKLISLGLTKKCRRWTEEELYTIRYMSSTGEYTYTDIATEVNATPQQVNGVCIYKGWNGNVKRSSSRGEELLGNILNEFFEGYKIEPQFHIAHGQKIDFFLPELNLGWEYDGEQHSKFTPAFHKTEEDFEHCRELDKVKERKCKELGITLIRINFDETLDLQLISDKYKKFGEGAGGEKLEEIKANGGVYAESTLALRKNQEYNKLRQKQRRQEYLQSDRYKEELDRARKYRRERYRRLRQFRPVK